jgi:hypothetical protein
MTAAEIARLPFFVAACKALGVEPNKRQARKAKGGTGRWKGHQLVACLNNINTPKREAA